MFVCLFLGAKCSTWFGSDDGSCFFALWLWQLLRPVRLLRNAHALGINRSCRPGIRYFLWNICYIFLGGWGTGEGFQKFMYTYISYNRLELKYYGESFFTETKTRESSLVADPVLWDDVIIVIIVFRFHGVDI